MKIIYHGADPVGFVLGIQDDLVGKGFTAPSKRPAAAAVAAAPAAPAAAEPDVKPCPLHPGDMLRRREKDGKSWYSHKQGEGFCRGGAK